MVERILLTGGAGYIGSHTVLALIENGFENIKRYEPSKIAQAYYILYKKVV